MNKKKNLNILKFPTNIVEAERQVEAILFAAEEPLDLESIQTRLKAKANVPKILKSLEGEPKKPVPAQEFVDELVKSEKFKDEDEVRRYIRKLINEAAIYESTPGHYNTV